MVSSLILSAHLSVEVLVDEDVAGLDPGVYQGRVGPLVQEGQAQGGPPGNANALAPVERGGTGLTCSPVISMVMKQRLHEKMTAQRVYHRESLGRISRNLTAWKPVFQQRLVQPRKLLGRERFQSSTRTHK